MAKIMLVEDDKSLREIYGIRLVAEGYDITSAGDGEEALAMVVKERPDLIISDVMMPKISGFDMLDILRSTPETKDIKIIMMTALSNDDQRQRGENLGADRYLVKSQVGIEDVVRVVHEVLGDGNPATQAQPVDRSATTESVMMSSRQEQTQPAAPVPPVATPQPAPQAPAEGTLPTPLQGAQPQAVVQQAQALAQATQPAAPVPPVATPQPAPQAPAEGTLPTPTPTPIPQTQPAAQPAAPVPPVATPQPAPQAPADDTNQKGPSVTGERIVSPLTNFAEESANQANLAKRIEDELSGNIQENQPLPSDNPFLSSTNSSGPSLAQPIPPATNQASAQQPPANV